MSNEKNWGDAVPTILYTRASTELNEQAKADLEIPDPDNTTIINMLDNKKDEEDTNESPTTE